jgi:DNA-binding NarL/FixJ family response regulator
MRDLQILIVDDLPIIRYGLRSLLEEQKGWKICSEAATGTAALQQVKTLKPEIVLLDLSLPDLEGIEVLRKIIEIRGQAGILALSEYESGEISRRIVASGARGLVLKSDGLKDLIRGVQALAKGRSFHSRRVAELIQDPPSSALSPGDPPISLTSRELQILKLLAQGKTNKEVAAALAVSVRTVEAHRASLMRKLELGSLSDLIYFALRNGIVSI